MIDIVSTLENIKEYCCKTKCVDCRFDTSPDDCQICTFFNELAILPQDWDIKKIKEILDE